MIKVDNWALGVIMYTLMAGYAPFYHRKQLMMMRMIQVTKTSFFRFIKIIIPGSEV